MPNYRTPEKESRKGTSTKYLDQVRKTNGKQSTASRNGSSISGRPLSAKSSVKAKNLQRSIRDERDKTMRLSYEVMSLKKQLKEMSQFAEAKSK